MKITAKLTRCMGRSPLMLAAAAVFMVFVSGGALAQTADVAEARATVGTVIPQQVRYTGALANRNGETVEAVFSIYASAEGGEALWTETQRVAVGADGSYTVVLGAASEKGLPQAVFAGGQARWVGVTLDRMELPRSPLSSVAYAMKAGDAETVGGLVSSILATKDDLAKLAQTDAAAIQAQSLVLSGIHPEVTPTGTGTMNYVPLWTASGNLGNSGIYQATNGFTGIGTTTPGGPLQVSTGAVGGANATLMLTQTNAASGNYYADIGLYNSYGLIGNLSALGAGYPAGNLFGANDVVFLGGQQKDTTNLIFLTNTNGALKFGTGGFAISNERMRIGVAGGVSVGNSYVATDPGAGNMIVSGKLGVGTKTPAAVLEVNGTAKFDGLATFAAGQTFPGTGTITGITTTSPLTGSGTTGSVALGFSTTALETTLNPVYAQLGAADTFADQASFNNGLYAVTTGPGAAVTARGTSGAPGVSASSDTGYGVQSVSTSGIAVSGTSTSADGGAFATAGEDSDGVYAINTANYTSSDGGNPIAVNGTSTGTNSVGVLGSGTEFGIYGTITAAGGFAVDGQAGTYGNAGVFENTAAQYATVFASNSAAGSSTTAPIVVEALATGINAYGVYDEVEGNGAYGIYAQADGGLESGSGRSGVGVKAVSTGADGNAMVGDATGKGGYGLYAHASGAQDSTRYASAGVYALADTGIGVEGFTVGKSKTYGLYQTGFSPAVTAGVWGDTSASQSNTFVTGGIMGTADDNSAGFFINNSKSYDTIFASNQASGGMTGLFKVFKGVTPLGTCGIGDGNLSCTGQIKMLASTGGGARTVETYSTQSAENWMEDYGTGAMAQGRGVVQIDPAFAETVTSDTSYHVFLTPLGDSQGHLYVVKLTPTSFEVRESGGGRSSIEFDYKIVAKRRGLEAQRLVDVTDRFNAEQADTKRRMSPATTAQASSAEGEPRMVERPASLARAGAQTGMANVRHGSGRVAAPAVSMPKKQSSTAKPVAGAPIEK